MSFRVLLKLRSVDLPIAQITLEAIQKFEKEYKGSLEEKEDLKAAYIGKSNIDAGLDTVNCVTRRDVQFSDIVVL